MKKTLTIGIIFLITGLLIGNNLYKKVDLNLLETLKEEDKYYLLQLGVYSNKESMQQETRDVSPKITVLKDDKYYVYIAITGSKDNLKKIKDIYDKQGIVTYTKEVDISDKEFKNNITQFDILIENASTDEEVLKIEEVILASYDKIIEN